MKNKFSILTMASAKARKLSKMLFCIFVLFSVILILISLCLIFPLANNIENKINNHPINRELYLEYPRVAEVENIKEDIQKMKKVEHVTSIYPIPPTLSVTDTSEFLKDTYTLDYLHQGFSPVITNGRCFKETERKVALVPNIIKDFDEDGKKITTIDGKDLIGKQFTFIYAGRFRYNTIIIGTYDTTDPVFYGNEIIVPMKDLYKCEKVIRKNLSKWESPLSDDYYYQITIDHYKNKVKAQKELSAIHQVDDFSSLNIDTELYNMVLTALIASLFVFIFLTISGLFIFLNSNIKNRTNELALYRCVGYKSKHLFRLIFTEYFIIETTSTIIGIICVSVINKNIINPYLYKLLGNTLMEMTARLNILHIIIVILFFMLTLYLVCKQAVKRSEETDLTILLKEH